MPCICAIPGPGGNPSPGIPCGWNPWRGKPGGNPCGGIPCPGNGNRPCPGIGNPGGNPWFGIPGGGIPGKECGGRRGFRAGIPYGGKPYAGMPAGGCCKGRGNMGGGILNIGGGGVANNDANVDGCCNTQAHNTHTQHITSLRVCLDGLHFLNCFGLSLLNKKLKVLELQQ